MNKQIFYQLVKRNGFKRRPIELFRTSVSLALSLVVLLSAPGCSTLELDDYQENQLTHSATVRSQSHANVSIEADIMNDSGRVRDHFGSNLLRNGLLPVYLRVRNQGDADLLVEENAFRLKLVAGDSGVAGAGEAKSDDAAMAVAVGGAVLLSPALLLIGGKMMSDASVINYNFNNNRFPTSTLSPGQEAKGFVYFQFHGELEELNGKMLITATLDPLPQGETLNFEF